MLALIKDGQVFSLHNEGSRIDFPDGAVLSPAKAGEAYSYYSLYTIQPADPVPEGKQVVSTSIELVGSDWKYVNTLADIPIPTPEELRAAMPDKTPREFRNALVDMGIDPRLVTAAIESIPFDVERMKALNAWEVMTTATRVDPYIDMIGAMFEKTPEQIDTAWMEATQN